jgi:phosphate starvation-inducible PhoH-like protein
MTRQHNSKGEGGHYDVTLISNEEYLLSTVVINSLNRMLKSREKRKNRRAESANLVKESFGRGMDILPFYSKTDHQEDLWTSLNKNTVTIAIGPSGVGKTLVALWWGLTEVAKGNLEKVYYVRSDVGCSHQRGRGALPGTKEEKMAPLIGPACDNLMIVTKSMGASEYLLSKKIVDPFFLEDIRGRSFNDCLIIFDEAQNSKPDNVKTVITRVGKNSKVIITGDTRQIDLDVFKEENGLLDCYHRLANIAGVGRVKFDRGDIVRNGVIADILEAYES